MRGDVEKGGRLLRGGGSGSRGVRGGGRGVGGLLRSLLVVVVVLAVTVLLAAFAFPEHAGAVRQTVSGKLFTNEKGSEVAGDTETGAPTVPYVDTRLSPPKEAWLMITEGKRRFKEQKGTCYFSNVLRRVNNRPGSAWNCYAACTGLNLHLKDTEQDQACIGWTMVKKRLCSEEEILSGACKEASEEQRGSNTCLLHHTFENHGNYRDRHCTSGKLLGEDLRFAHFVRQGDEQSNTSQEIPDDVKTTGNIEEEKFEETCPERAKRMGNKPGKPMRIFVACLQSSGCTLLSYLLAQRDRTTSILDLGVRQDVPGDEFYARATSAYPAVDTIVLKHPIRGVSAIPPEDWIHQVQAKFKPDVTILFIRNPVDMFLHIVNHIDSQFSNRIPSDEVLGKCEAVKSQGDSHGLVCGTPESKLEAIERLYVEYSTHNRLQLDEVITYEEICTDRALLHGKLKKLGICIAEDDLRQPKWSIVDIMRFSYKYFLSGRKRDGGVFWGPGNLQNTFHSEDGLKNAEEEAYRLCKLEKTNKVRTKLLSHSIQPYWGMTLTQIEELVKKHAPSIFKLYFQQ